MEQAGEIWTIAGKLIVKQNKISSSSS